MAGYQTHAWTLLYKLQLYTKHSFDTATKIRSTKLHDWEVYALFRLVQRMEEPGRSRARSLIQKALQFRNSTAPKKNKPLSIPWLAHPHFTAVQRWLRN